MNEIGNIINRIKSRKEDQKQETAKQTSETVARVSLLIPWLIFIFANAVLAFGEYRVWHYVYQITSRPELAWGTLAATGIGAEIWFVAWKYPLARDIQKWMSIFMMFLNFGSATYIGFGDFFVDNNGVSYGAKIDTMIMLIAAVLLLDIVIGLVYFLVDKQVKRDRERAEYQADLLDQKNTATLIDQMLSNAETVLERTKALYGRYGEKNVEDMLALLAGDSGKDKEIVGNLRKTQQNFSPQVQLNMDTPAVHAPLRSHSNNGQYPDGDPNAMGGG